MFNHPAVVTIIFNVVWGPTQKLEKLIPANCMNLDILLAFTVTIIQWALINLGKGPKTTFEANIHGPFYQKVLDRLHGIHGEQDPVALICLENLTYTILTHGNQLSQLYLY